MVKIIYEALKYSIKNYKNRVRHHEKHGRGKNAMEDKEKLKRLQRRFEEFDK